MGLIRQLPFAFALVAFGLLFLDGRKAGSSRETTTTTSPKAGSPNPSQKRPIVFLPSHGTTGTRFVHETFCLLGVPGIHNGRFCQPWTDEDQKVLKAKSPAWTAHVRAQRAYYAHMCSNRRMFSQNKTAEQSVWCPATDERWIKQMKGHIDNVLSAGDIDAFSDTPYPDFADYILEAAERIRGVPPIVVLSERDPAEWAQRRKSHTMPMCSLDKRGPSSSVLGHVESDVEFDYIACHEEAKKRGMLPKILKVKDFIARTSEEYAMQQATTAYGMFQDRWRNRSDVTASLFSRFYDEEKELAVEFDRDEPRFREYWGQWSKIKKAPDHSVLVLSVVLLPLLVWAAARRTFSRQSPSK